MCYRTEQFSDMLIFLGARVLTMEERTCIYGETRRQERTFWEWTGAESITATVNSCFQKCVYVCVYACLCAHKYMNVCVCVYAYLYVYINMYIYLLVLSSERVKK